MRLNPSQVQGILASLTPFLNRIAAELYLYGSRTQDSRKGGDIDLLLLVNTIQDKDALLSQKHKILSKIKSEIGEQKIDLKIATKTELEEDVFLQLAASTAQRIKLRSFNLV